MRLSKNQLFTLFLAVILVSLYTYFVDPSNLLHRFCTKVKICSSEPNYTDLDEIPDRNETITILMWTEWFWKVPVGPLTECSRPNCMLTTDHSLLNKSKAVVFHTRNLDWNHLPSQRRVDQYFVFHVWEPPYRTGGDFSADWKKTYFNLTMTHRRDSDVYAPYGKVIKRQKPLRVDLKTLAKNKTKPIAWLVSNCHSPSGREVLVGALQRYIKVDVYGGCGRLKCANTETCDGIFERDYKFYLSFENSMCKDYVTEKFFLHLQRYVVPIVLERRNYEHFCPEYQKPWFIAVDDYKHAKDLAQHLKYLHENFTAYYEYLSWHEHYETFLHHASSSTSGVSKNHWCDLCRLVAKKKGLGKIRNVVDWWRDGCDHSYKLFHDFTKGDFA